MVPRAIRPLDDARFLFRKEFVMNKLEFYFWSIADTISQGLNYVTHYHQYHTNGKVIDSSKSFEKRRTHETDLDSSKSFRKRKTSEKVIRHHGRKGRG